MPRYPALFQANTRVWLTQISRRLGRPATLDDIDDAEVDRVVPPGFDWLWLLGVWQTGQAGARVSASSHEWRREFEATLADLGEEDILGSCFAITGYRAHERLGGDEALARLRLRLRERDLKLMLDFVPNHTALDHPWVETNPEYYIAGSEEDLVRAPQNYTRIATAAGPKVFAYGRDPYFPGWPDTLQLNYGNAVLQRAMADELAAIATRCDGVRCDMAMLMLPDVFSRTWGKATADFWPRAIPTARAANLDFILMAEVYWDLEWTLQQQGFDYTYDKRLYDRLREGCPANVRAHFWADHDYQEKLTRFLENHDEPRAAATFPGGTHRAAAVATFLAPGLRLFYQGQLEGRRVRVSPHLILAPEEPVDWGLSEFYDRLLEALALPTVRDGTWRLAECAAAWPGNPSHEAFIGHLWQHEQQIVLAIANYSSHQAQCFVRLPVAGLAGRAWRFEDHLTPAAYDRDGADLASRGLYLDLPAWGYHVFEVSPLAAEALREAPVSESHPA